MNGAIAELFATTSNAPTSTSVITIGASQYFLFSLMNCQSSLTTCAFDIPTPSEHLLVVARIMLPFRIRTPVGTATRTATAEGVPTKKPLDDADGSDNQKEHDCQYHPGHDERQPFSQ